MINTNTLKDEIYRLVNGQILRYGDIKRIYACTSGYMVEMEVGPPILVSQAEADYLANRLMLEIEDRRPPQQQRHHEDDLVV